MRKDIFKEVGKEWGDYLETGKDKINKEKFEIETYNTKDLLKCYKEWKEEETDEKHMDSYQIAAKFLKKYKIPFLSEEGINEFVEDINLDRYYYKGLFFSAVINELYKDEKIHLYFNNSSCLGCCNGNKKIVVEGDCNRLTGEYMESGEIIVNGDCGKWTGSDMKGGKIIVNGDCNDWTGEDMTGGEIIVKGNCRDKIGEHMKSGEIVVEGNCGYFIGHGMSGGKIKICGDNFNPKEQISKFAEKGEIYHKDKLVWKDGKFMEAYRAEGEDGLNDRTVPIFSLREKSAPSEGRVCSSGEEI